MQNGDLATHFREELIVILEGVLCQVTVNEEPKRRFRRQQPATYHINWHELPLKRMVTIKERWPDYELNVVTFISPRLADEAAEFLDLIDAPYDSISYQGMGSFTGSLRYRPHVRAVYDCDPQRLDNYGQLGRAVVRGEDF